MNRYCEPLQRYHTFSLRHYSTELNRCGHGADLGVTREYIWPTAPEIVKRGSDILTEMAVLGAVRGESKSLEILIRYWHPRLFAHAVKLTGDRDGAEDVMQEVWIAVSKGIRRLRDPVKFKGWIYRITGNKSTDWIRSKQVRRSVSQRLEKEISSEDFVESIERAKDDPVATLRARLSDLPDTQRIILTLFYLEELSVKEIGRALDIAAGTVKSRLYHARKMLREALEENNELN